MTRRLFLPLLTLALGLGACDRGRVTLSVTDAPIDEATSVIIEFRGVELDSALEGLQAVEFDPPLRIDLLALTAGQSALLLDEESMPAGDYNFIRLRVNAEQGELDSVYERDDGAQFSLQMSSADENGLTLARAFDVREGREIAFTIDFDLRRSILEPASGEDDYRLRPTLRLVEDEEAGQVTGSVAASRIPVDCTPAVYVYAGANVEPDDVDGSNADGPVTSALIEFDTFSGTFEYTTAPLPEGDYTVAYTCEALDDDPLTDDVIEFPVIDGVQIVAGETATLNIL